MAKCKNCNSCTTVVRVPFPLNDKIVSYCSLCQKVYDIRSTQTEITDPVVVERTIQIYKSMEGNKV